VYLKKSQAASDLERAGVQCKVISEQLCLCHVTGVFSGSNCHALLGKPEKTNPTEGSPEAQKRKTIIYMTQSPENRKKEYLGGGETSNLFFIFIPQNWGEHDPI